MSFNAVAAILNADKVWPEPLSLPDSLEGATPQLLAEARSRIAQIIQVGREINKLIDQELAGVLQGSAMLYGQDVYRPSNGKGTAKVSDSEAFFSVVAEAVVGSTVPGAAALLGSLFPANSVRLTALPKLAAESYVSPESIRDTFITYEPSTSPLSVMPIQKAPKYLADLEEGEVRSLQ